MINALYSLFYHVYITYDRYMLVADTCVVHCKPGSAQEILEDIEGI